MFPSEWKCVCVCLYLAVFVLDLVIMAGSRVLVKASSGMPLACSYHWNLTMGFSNALICACACMRMCVRFFLRHRHLFLTVIRRGREMWGCDLQYRSSSRIQTGVRCIRGVRSNHSTTCAPLLENFLVGLRSEELHVTKMSIAEPPSRPPHTLPLSDHSVASCLTCLAERFHWTHRLDVLPAPQ